MRRKRTWILLGLAKKQIQFKKTGIVGSYTKNLRSICKKAKKNKKRVWGTTELHTSIQTAGRRFVNGWYRGKPRHDDKGTWANVAEWIGSWTHVPSKKNPKLTVMEGIKSSTSIKEAFGVLTGETGIGEYYGYHCSTSNSVNPALLFSHDDTFVAPGPGARNTLELMFPGLKSSQVSFGDRVVWIRENQHEIMNLSFHKSLWNFKNSYGVTIFKHEQNELKSYGTEVGLCQYSVYCRLKANPELISRRKVARTKTSITNHNNLIIEKQKGKKMILENNNKLEKAQANSSKDDNLNNRWGCVSSKEEMILNAMDAIYRPCTHNQVLKQLESQDLAKFFKTRSNWKETWKVMKELAKRGVIIKNGKVYDFSRGSSSIKSFDKPQSFIPDAKDIGQPKDILETDSKKNKKLLNIWQKVASLVGLL